MTKPMRDPELFWTKARQTESGCWEWQAHITTDGYGRLHGENRKSVYAHRMAWEYMRGPIPEGLILDHLCRNRRCINPDHLEPVTIGVNNIRGAGPYGAVRTECKHGHDVTDPANVYTLPGGTEHRCRACETAANARRRARRQARGDLRKVLKSRCVRGHEFTAENIRVRGDGHRVCRLCDNERAREYRLRVAAQATGVTS